MNLNLTSVVMFVGGVVLIYSGLYNVSPKDVVVRSLQGQSPREPAKSKKEYARENAPTATGAWIGGGGTFGTSGSTSGTGAGM